MSNDLKEEKIVINEIGQKREATNVWVNLPIIKINLPMSCCIHFINQVHFCYWFTKWNNSLHFSLRVFSKRKKNRLAQKEFSSRVAVWGFFANRYVDLGEIQSLIDAAAIYLCMHDTLASTVFQIKRSILCIQLRIPDCSWMHCLFQDDEFHPMNK